MKRRPDRDDNSSSSANGAGSNAGHSRPYFEAVCNNTTLALFILDERQHCIYMNSAAERLTGYALAEVRSQVLHDVLHHTRPDGRPYPREECPIHRAFPENSQEQGEEIFTHKDGAFYPVAYTASPICEEGTIVGTIVEVRSIAQEKAAEQALREETHTLEILNRTGAALVADLDLERIIQAVTDAATEVTGAAFGAFFYNVLDEQGESYMLYTLSGVPREAFSKFPMPRNTAVFGPTFRGEGIVRVDDILKSPAYGKNPPYHGMPKGHLPVRSYLAVPVVSRSGEVLGGLFFGHEKTGVFTERAEQIVAGIAAQAAMAIDNAQLYAAAQREIAERKRAEEHRTMLINELNHRVKNTLATVHAIARQTSRHVTTLDSFTEAFEGRLLALSRVHELLTADAWEGASLDNVARGVLAPHGGGGIRISVKGPDVHLPPRAAMSLGIALNELATNATKYGALSATEGRVDLGWIVEPADGGTRVRLTWIEAGGPKVQAPSRRGFGTRVIEQSLAADLDAAVHLGFDADGVRCTIEFALDPRDEATA